MAEVSVLADRRCELGEGVLWHEGRQELFWFDILQKTMMACDAEGKNFRTYALSKMASAAAVIDKMRLMVAFEDGLEIFDLEGETFSPYLPLERDNLLTRSNDGRCDPWGRFWLGTMGKNAEDGAGAIYMIERGKVKTLQTKISIPNSIAFSPDRKRAYFADSKEQEIFFFDLDPISGEVGRVHSFVSLKGSEISPDGSVVDENGCLWNAQWDGERVVCYAPNGTISQIVPLPVQRPTCPAFGGQDRKTLFVTSAYEGLGSDHAAENGMTLKLLQDVVGMTENSFLL